MPTSQSARFALPALPELEVKRSVPLSQYTRFGIGGPADYFVETANETTFLEALKQVTAGSTPFLVLGAGSNLIVHDDGYRGIVLRYTGSELRTEGAHIHTASGVELQHLVDFSIEHGFDGLHTMTGIPGWVGAAIYGNAGAYGHSISEFVRQVRFTDAGEVRVFDNRQCQFAYRESVFKRHKDWIILSAVLELPSGDPQKLAQEAARILETRNAKYPPSMRCAGSIFKNLLWAQLPESVQAQVPSTIVREGKVPSAWFLEQVGAKGMRCGGITVAAYHANLIYNEGGGRAVEICHLIQALKQRVAERFGFELEEEVQYVGY